MNWIAIKMLFGNKTALIGVIFGVFLATLLISQQSAIFLGLIKRSYRIVTDAPDANVWVIDPSTRSNEKVRQMKRYLVNFVRSTSGVEWASGLNLALLPLSTGTGVFDVAEVYGVDDATLIGLPAVKSGNLADLNRQNTILLDTFSAKEALAKNNGKKSLEIKDQVEINNKKAVIVGITRPTRGFYPQPIVHLTYSNFIKIFPNAKNTLSFILAKTNPDVPVEKVIDQINQNPSLLALTRKQMEDRVVKTFLETGILINFLLSVIVAFIIGLSISGQTFYLMTEHNLTYFALFKAIGGTEWMILKMIGLQVMIAGSIGFILGSVATFLWGYSIEGTTLAFDFPWQLPFFTGFIVLSICFLTAGISIRKVFKVDPKVLMGN
jgi:putative ABC transport system permease protein